MATSFFYIYIKICIDIYFNIYFDIYITFTNWRPVVLLNAIFSFKFYPFEMFERLCAEENDIFARKTRPLTSKGWVANNIFLWESLDWSHIPFCLFSDDFSHKALPWSYIEFFGPDFGTFWPEWLRLSQSSEAQAVWHMQMTRTTTNIHTG